MVWHHVTVSVLLRVTMLSLDDEDLIADRMIASVDPEPRRRVNLRPLLLGLLVLVLGGGLGGGAYMLSNMDTRDVIALLDIGDQPRLAMQMPGLGGKSAEPPPPALGAGPLLTPPGAPSLTPPPIPGEPAAKPEAAGVAPMPMTPPLPKAESKPEPAKPELAALPPPPPVIAPPPIPPVPATPAAPPPVPAKPLDQPVPAAAYQAPTYASLPARATQPVPLGPVPADGLWRQSAYGPLPVVPRDGRQPWKVYSRPFENAGGKPRLAVVVTGLGLDKDATEAAITKLPPEVTLAFSPYAGALDKWVKRARDFGHEVMVMLPAEAVGFPARDPGPWGLLVANPPEENISRLEQVLARVPGAMGVLAPDGAFVRSPKLGPVLIALKDRGVAFAAESAKVDLDMPHTTVTASINADLFRDAIEASLSAAAKAAKDSGSGLLVVSPRPVAFDRLLGWFDRLNEQGIALAPASATVKQTGKS